MMSQACLKVPYEAGTSTRASTSGAPKVSAAPASRASMSGRARLRMDWDIALRIYGAPGAVRRARRGGCDRAPGPRPLRR